jgi:2-keto-4-pentenoate hydratase
MNLHDIAKNVLEVLGTGRQLDPFSKVYPDFGLKDAYNVTAAVRAQREARGERPIGRKIGFTNRTIWEEYGVYAPIWGYVYDGTVRDLTSDPLEVSLKGLAEPRIEPEIMFGLAAPPEPGMHEQALIGCIDWIAHGFEIVQSIFPNWSFQAADTVAGYGLHGRLFVGPRHGGRSGRASFPASRSIFSATELISITGRPPMSSMGHYSPCAIWPRRWRRIPRVRRSPRARSSPPERSRAPFPSPPARNGARNSQGFRLRAPGSASSDQVDSRLISITCDSI